eukprot:6196488-Pleurochrysis_carterae.AAC.2
MAPEQLDDSSFSNDDALQVNGNGQCSHAWCSAPDSLCGPKADADQHWPPRTMLIRSMPLYVCRMPELDATRRFAIGIGWRPRWQSSFAT